MKAADFISWQKKSGQSIKVQGVTITPQSQVLEIWLPYGGYVWHRPTAVMVEDGSESKIIPITDVTRQALWAILGLTIMVNLLFLRKR